MLKRRKKNKIRTRLDYIYNFFVRLLLRLLLLLKEQTDNNMISIKD